MSCFLGEFKDLMIKYNIKGISITANMNEYGGLNIDTYERIYNEERTDDYIAHKPTQVELCDIFRKENC